MRKRALITGASAGIGREIARYAASQDHDLVLVARSEQKLEALADELSSFGIDVIVIPLDLTAPEAGESLAAQLDGVPIDVLVNNAGLGSTGTFVQTELGAILSQIDLNMRVLTELTHRFVPLMLERGDGVVLNIASLAGFQAGPNMSVYYATKAYVISFSEGLAEELKGTGVSVTAHCPGATHSDFGKTAGNEDTLLFRLGAASAEEVAKHAWQSAMRRKVIAVPGFSNKLTALSTRLVPRVLSRKLAARLNQ